MSVSRHVHATAMRLQSNEQIATGDEVLSVQALLMRLIMADNPKQSDSVQ